MGNAAWKFQQRPGHPQFSRPYLYALASNFNELDKAAEPFSVDAAIRYLKTRDDATRRTALRYIRKSPQEVQTPVRAAVTQHWPEG